MFLKRGNSEYAILRSTVYTTNCSLTISGSLFYRISNVTNKFGLKGRMSSKGVALAAVAAASAILAYVVFRKKKVQLVIWMSNSTVPKRVLILRTWSLIRTFLAFWVLICISGSLFSLFGFIHAKNVNSACMYTNWECIKAYMLPIKHCKCIINSC